MWGDSTRETWGREPNICSFQWEAGIRRGCPCGAQMWLLLPRLRGAACGKERSENDPPFCTQGRHKLCFWVSDLLAFTGKGYSCQCPPHGDSGVISAPGQTVAQRSPYFTCERDLNWWSWCRAESWQHYSRCCRLCGWKKILRRDLCYPRSWRGKTL